MPSVEKTGKTVDIAINKALQELNLERDKVEVDILEIESSGLFGLFGRKNARVRVTPLREKNLRPSEKPGGKSRQSPKQSESRAESTERKERAKPSPRQSRQNEPGSTKPAQKPATDSAQPQESAGTNDAPVGDKAKEILETIISHLGIEVEVSSQETDNVVALTVRGEGVGQLIGRRGRTVGSVQYMISRLINEDRSRKKKVTVDVDGYCATRSKTIQDLAVSTAEIVLQKNAPIALKPMSSQDRRMIHVALQEKPEVSTESFGEERNRFVVVYPAGMASDEVADFARKQGPRRRSPNRNRRPRNQGRSRSANTSSKNQ